MQKSLAVKVEPALQIAVDKLHKNTRHKPPRVLAKALVMAGAPRETVEAAKRIKCEECRALRPPSTRRRAGIPSASRFNDVVNTDLLKIENAVGQTFWVWHAVDSASKLHQARILKNKTSKDVIRSLNNDGWFSAYHAPVYLVADMGPEFTSDEFADYVELWGSALHHIPVEAPWQNGAAERGGAVLRASVNKIARHHAVTSEAEMEIALAKAVAELNEEVDGEMGHSPNQMVFGKARRDEASLLNGVDRYRAAHSLIASNGTFGRSVAMRETARRAILKLKYSRSLRGALLQRSRTVPEGANLDVGDMVYFWRQQKAETQDNVRKGKRKLLLRRWHGPGVLLGKEGLTAVYVGYRGHVTKCAPEAVRRATAFEQMTASEWGEALETVLRETENPPDREPTMPVFAQDAESEAQQEHDDSAEAAASGWTPPLATGLDMRAYACPAETAHAEAVQSTYAADVKTFNATRFSAADAANTSWRTSGWMAKTPVLPR